MLSCILFSLILSVSFISYFDMRSIQLYTYRRTSGNLFFLCPLIILSNFIAHWKFCSTLFVRYSYLFSYFSFIEVALCVVILKFLLFLLEINRLFALEIGSRISKHAIQERQ